VISSTVDFMAQKVTVVGNMTHEEVFKRVSRTGKQTAFWPEEPKEEKEEKKEEKEEEKKEEETKEKSKEEPEKEV
jgi:ribosomal protein L12E/L44/L45/RPP1/RPP2